MQQPIKQKSVLFSMEKISTVWQNIWKSCLTAKLLWHESLLSSKKLFKKLPTLLNIPSKSFAQKNGSVWKCRKKLFKWIAHAYGWLNKTLIFKNKSRYNSKRNKCKSDTFVRPPCIMIKAVLNLLIILRESYLIPLYILSVKLFQKSIAAMYLFTKSFRA